MDVFDYNGQLIPFETLVNNVEQVFTGANIRQTLSGATWYFDAHNLARVIAKNTGVDLGIVTLVIAAVSPRNTWYFDLVTTGNLNSALRVIEAWQAGQSADSIKIPTFNNGKTKAFSILTDYGNGITDLEYYRIKYFKGSPKTWNFSQNILYPTSSDFVTIDGHATNLAVNPNERKPLTAAIKLDSKSRYEILVRAYQSIASKYGVRAWQVQAITWTVYRDWSTIAKTPI